MSSASFKTSRTSFNESDGTFMAPHGAGAAAAVDKSESFLSSTFASTPKKASARNKEFCLAKELRLLVV